MPAERIAQIIHGCFDRFYDEFKALTRGAKLRFERREWVGVLKESNRRIDLYRRHVAMTLEELTVAGCAEADRPRWAAAHRQYEFLVAGRPDFEVAQTFFNAMSRKVFGTKGVAPDIEFVKSDLAGLEERRGPPLFRIHDGEQGPRALFQEILSQPRFDVAFKDLGADVEYLAGRFVDEGLGAAGTRVEMLHEPFFRAREAYLVGRIVEPQRVRPLLIPLQNVAEGVVVDGAMFTALETQQVFSPTRSYFFVNVDKPWDLVKFLGSIMPELTVSERYIAIAHHRHGKSMIYRELVDHLEKTDGKFIIAPGIKGMVMAVFTETTYRNVFKIIRDSFEKPATTRAGVLRSYDEVFRSRRIGRLADTQEFEHLAFARDRFDPQCLQELRDKAARTVREEGDSVVFDHMYIEEKMIPLNLYMASASELDGIRAMVDYGYAIKDLAASNVFAGDLLWKNFGVTRLGWCVLYDYDEVVPVTRCNFRRVPPPRNQEEEFSAEPYYSVSEYDVFPENWTAFICPKEPAAIRSAFLAHHADLFDPVYWQRLQRSVAQGLGTLSVPYEPRDPELHRFMGEEDFNT